MTSSADPDCVDLVATEIPAEAVRLQILDDRSIDVINTEDSVIIDFDHSLQLSIVLGELSDKFSNLQSFSLSAKILGSLLVPGTECRTQDIADLIPLVAIVQGQITTTLVASSSSVSLGS